MSIGWRTVIPRTAAVFAGLFVALLFIGFWAAFALHLLHPCIGRFFVRVGTASTAT